VLGNRSSDNSRVCVTDDAARAVYVSIAVAWQLSWELVTFQVLMRRWMPQYQRSFELALRVWGASALPGLFEGIEM